MSIEVPRKFYHGQLGWVVVEDDDEAPEPAAKPPEPQPPTEPPVLPTRPESRRYCPYCDGLDGYHAEDCNRPSGPPAPRNDVRPKHSVRKAFGQLLRAIADQLDRD